MSASCGGQRQGAPGSLAASRILADSPGSGHPVHDQQTQPAIGLLLGGQESHQVRVLVLDRHMQLSAAHLNPQLQRRAGEGHGKSDQLASQQRRRIG
jgi:hypothetical protein